MNERDLITEEQRIALEHARSLVEAGVPLFLARPDLDESGTWRPTGGLGSTGYWIPKGWQDTVADPAVLDFWEPGMALCAVTGIVVDLLDVDPRSGGEESLAYMREAGLVPKSYGRQFTPSGGTHDFIGRLEARSLDKAMPGVDVKAGLSTGEGRGFAFIAPTVKMSKTTKEPVAYTWIEPPNLEAYALTGVDDTGSALAEFVSSRGKGSDAEIVLATYEGPVYAELSDWERRLADNQLESTLGLWRDTFEEALLWPDGHTDGRGRGWELLTRDFVWAMGRLAATPYINCDIDKARSLYEEILPEEFAQTDECSGKWWDGVLEKASERGIEEPWWAGFAPVEEDEDLDDLPSHPPRLDDAHLVEWVAKKGLGGDWVWAGGMGWLNWDGRRWVTRDDVECKEAIRVAMIDANVAALADGADRARMQALGALLSNARLSSITSLLRGVVAVDPGGFDQKPDLLNVGNGVVDLRTGELLPHDRSYRLTKITHTKYKPGATHQDWETAMNVLEPEVIDWLQIRFGQAATGYPTSDDVLPIGQGGGSNGKSTFLAAIYQALGEHVSQVPEKLIRAGVNDHPTELMTLYGARIAVIDETPEEGVLNVARLKAILGQEYVTARPVFRDNVTWKATHSLFVMTNYVPRVAQTDHGTWRRLALVRFEKTFPRDESFRIRMAAGDGGRKEAVLAWVVEGARHWYALGRVMPEAPPKVLEDTAAWRGDADSLISYIQDRIVFDGRAMVSCADLLDDFNEWLEANGSKPWSSRTFNSRFEGHSVIQKHGVHRDRPRSLEGLVRRGGDTSETGRLRVWQGIRWKGEDDDLI